MSSGKLVIGTRGSALARWQADTVARAIADAFPDIQVQTRVITTTGDARLDIPLASIGDKGLFTKELEVALLSGEVDLCVHSMKDLPSELPAGCTLGAMLPRADARDALVCGPRIAGCTSLQELPQGTRLGTGSARRTAQLKAGYSQVVPLPIRGNVDTRLAKAQGEDYDGAVLAVAGLVRMGFEEHIACRLDVDQMVPAVGQGAIGVEVREGDAAVSAVCAAINHAPTWECVHAERLVLARLGGGCQAPVGVHVRFEGSQLLLDAIVLSPDGSACVRVSKRADAGDDALALAAQVADNMLEQGARELLQEGELR